VEGQAPEPSSTSTPKYAVRDLYSSVIAVGSNLNIMIVHLKHYKKTRGKHAYIATYTPEKHAHHGDIIMATRPFTGVNVAVGKELYLGDKWTKQNSQSSSADISETKEKAKPLNISLKDMEMLNEAAKSYYASALPEAQTQAPAWFSETKP
jgi:hypothetical protein